MKNKRKNENKFSLVILQSFFRRCDKKREKNDTGKDTIGRERTKREGKIENWVRTKEDIKRERERERERETD